MEASKRSDEKWIVTQERPMKKWKATQERLTKNRVVGKVFAGYKHSWEPDPRDELVHRENARNE